MTARYFISLAIFASIACGADFTTYIGDANPYQVAAITTDSAGNTYVTGSRFIESAPPQSSTDVFVTKLDVAGTIIFTATFGGKGNDEGSAIAVDAAGNIWVGGVTTSENFPLHGAAFQTTVGRGSTGFLVELAPDGTVTYSSYFGGLLGTSSVNGVALDPSGAVYLTGTTDSSDFPTTPGLPAGAVTANEITPVSGAFITKLDSAAVHVIYSAVIVGSTLACSGGSSCFLAARNTSGYAIALEAAGDAFVTGNTNTTDLPVTPGGASGYGAFAAKINAAGNQLAYLTYLGPGENAISPLGPTETVNATAIAADLSGNAYLTGYTNDPGFPATAGAYQTTLNASLTQSSVLPPDAFAMKLNSAGATIWATYLGGPGNDEANSVSLDSSGNVWLAGSNGAGFPSGKPGFVANAGDFLAELSADGSGLDYEVEFPAGGAGQTVTVDAVGVVHVASGTGLISTITPAQPAASRILGVVNAAYGPLAGRISPGEVISIFGFGLGPSTPVTAVASEGFFPSSLGGVQVLLNGSAIPLLYVSAAQINAEIPAPFGLADAVVQVINNSSPLPDFRVSVDSSIFGIFMNSDGSVAAINQDGTLNSASNPAQAGTIVSIWATGFGGAFIPASGAVATVANNWCSECQISIGNLNETVQYAGAAPGLIDGVMQINFMVPSPKTGVGASEEFFQFSLGGSGYIWMSP